MLQQRRCGLGRLMMILIISSITLVALTITTQTSNDGVDDLCHLIFGKRDRKREEVFGIHLTIS
jgi:hypothetical protein